MDKSSIFSTTTMESMESKKLMLLGIIQMFINNNDIIKIIIANVIQYKVAYAFLIYVAYEQRFLFIN